MIRHIGPIPDPKTPAELLDDIKLAERAGNHALLARLCLDLAQAQPERRTSPNFCANAFAPPCVPRVLQFMRRPASSLRIGRGSQDLTTACEHWQIARGLFFDMNDRELHKTAEGLMLRHGCPTDWVLTDF